MTQLMRRAGAACPRWLVLAVCLAALTGRAALVAQEKLQAPGTDDRSKFESFRQGNAPVVVENDKNATEQNRQVLDKFARYYVLRFNLPTTKNEDFRNLHDEAVRRMNVPRYDRLNAQQKQFVAEYGKAMITHLEGLALNSAKPQVRLNAAWLASEVGKIGYDGAAELCIKILEKEDMSDGIKLYAIKGLHNLFAIVPDPIVPDKTVFQNTKSVELSPLEVRAIQALINYIERKVELTENMKPDEIDALRYVRREAVRALGNVRVQTVKQLGKIVSRPAFVLLKVARNEIPPLWPPQPWRDPRDQPPIEQFEAIVGFCRLKPDINVRDFNVDYAAYHIGRAIYDIANFRNSHGTDKSLAWKAAGSWLRESLDHWRDTSEKNKLQDARLIKDLIDVCDGQCLVPIENDIEGSKTADVAPLRKWLEATPPKSTSLFKNDAATAITVP